MGTHPIFESDFDCLTEMDVIKDKDRLYRLIVGQLQYDGYVQVSKNLMQQVRPGQGIAPSDKLMKIFQAGLKQIKLEEEAEEKSKLHSAGDEGLDLELDQVGGVVSPDPSQYETCYVTAHKGACRASAWTKCGNYCATGSVDSSIKILDVERMVAKSSLPVDMSGAQSDSAAAVDHPVIRTLYDHLDEVTSLVFHPREQLLISASKDYTVKVFDWSKSSAKKAIKTIQEVEWVRTLGLHPSGDWLVVGTQNPTIRFYDLATSACYTSPMQSDHHRGPITDISFSQDAKIFATSSKDGCIKLWDGVSHRCFSTTDRAHDGYEVCSIQFTKNGKFLLTSGKDSICRLWEISTARSIHQYTGAEDLRGVRQMHRSNACFNHTEERVMFPSEKNVTLCSWNSRTAERGKLLALGHNSIARHISHSPTQSAFLSCSDDFRARFWFHKQQQT